MLIINHSEVRELLPMRDCMEVVGKALADLARGEGVQPLRSGIKDAAAHRVGPFGCCDIEDAIHQPLLHKAFHRSPARSCCVEDEHFVSLVRQLRHAGIDALGRIAEH